MAARVAKLVEEVGGFLDGHVVSGREPGNPGLASAATRGPELSTTVAARYASQGLASCQALGSGSPGPSAMPRRIHPLAPAPTPERLWSK